MRQLKSIALLSLLLPFCLIADQQNNNVAVGTRHLSEEAAAELQSDQDQVVDAEEGEESDLQTSGFMFDQYPPVYFSNSSHWLTAISVNNDQYSLQLEDGSQWRIQSYDSSKVLNWKANDPLVITQNNRWFTKYNYQIINNSNGTKVEAKLFLGPFEHSEYSHFIASIDKDNRVIALNDSTHWEISYLDKAIFREWQLSDYIIIGTNSNTSIWDSEKETLLINVNMDNCARAKQY